MPEASPRAPSIEVRGLRKSYGGREVLRGIELDVVPGQVLGYLGANDAGKSTTAGEAEAARERAGRGELKTVSRACALRYRRRPPGASR